MSIVIVFMASANVVFSLFSDESMVPSNLDVEPNRNDLSPRYLFVHKLYCTVYCMY
jgi:hypothetical protein